jgi:cytochrome c2
MGVVSRRHVSAEFFRAGQAISDCSAARTVWSRRAG